MSQPPPPFSPAPPPAYVAPVPVQSLGYSGHANAGTRPGMLTAIGVISIVLACLSVIGNLMGGMYGAMFLIFSQLARNQQAATVAVAPAPTPGMATPPPPTTDLPTTAPSTAAAADQDRGLGPADRATVVEALSGLQPMINARKLKLHALLATAGRDLFNSPSFAEGDGGLRSAQVRAQVIRFGEAEPSEAKLAADSAGRKPDYFELTTGRIELSNDETLFVPADGSPEVRVTGDPPADSQVPTYSNAAAWPPAAQALTAAQAQAIAQEAQASSGNRLTPAQASAIQSLLQAPTQQMALPADVGSAIMTANVDPQGNAVVQFNRGGWVQVGPDGTIMNQFSPQTMPLAPFSGINSTPCILVIAASVVDGLLAIYLFTIGIMVLRDSPRGGRLHTFYAWIKIPLAIAGAAAFMWMFYGFTSGMTANVAPTAAAGARASQLTGFVMGAVMMAAMGCVYPIALLVVLRSRAIRDYYNSVRGG